MGDDWRGAASLDAGTGIVTAVGTDIRVGDNVDSGIGNGC